MHISVCITFVKLGKVIFRDNIFKLLGNPKKQTNPVEINNGQYKETWHYD